MSLILLVEDDRDLAEGLRNNLEFEGYSVDVAADGKTALARLPGSDVSLIILDLMIPGPHGFEVLSRLRASGATMPVLVLSARGGELDKVRALRAGADDYVTKPFSLLELLARIEAILRRGASPARFRIGPIAIFADSRTVLRNGVRVELAPREYDLLEALARREGRLATRAELLREVWGHSGTVASRTVDTHIRELRRKLEDSPSQPRHILTVRKRGYRLDMS